MNKIEELYYIYIRKKKNIDNKNIYYNFIAINNKNIDKNKNSINNKNNDNMNIYNIFSPRKNILKY